jgi:hypothetical protein
LPAPLHSCGTALLDEVLVARKLVLRGHPVVVDAASEDARADDDLASLGVVAVQEVVTAPPTEDGVEFPAQDATDRAWTAPRSVEQFWVTFGRVAQAPRNDLRSWAKPDRDRDGERPARRSLTGLGGGSTAVQLPAHTEALL